MDSMCGLDWNAANKDNKLSICYRMKVHRNECYTSEQLFIEIRFRLG